MRAQPATYNAAVELLVFASVAGAVILWALGEVFTSRVMWTSGAVLMTVHSIAAFLLFYDGSHAIARVETMRQTEALTGIEFPGGIYINYLFLAVWAADAAWWWMSPRSHAQRPLWATRVIRGFIFFIIVNGAVIFADGGARVLGVAAVAAVVFGAWHRHDRSDTSTRRGAWPRCDSSDTIAWPRCDSSDTIAENAQASHQAQSQ